MTPERRTLWPAAALCLTIALGACQAEKKPQVAGSAGGEVLPGSASDAMLPVDQVRSQPPLAPKATTSASESAPKSKPGAAGKSDAPAEEVPPAKASPEPATEAE